MHFLFIDTVWSCRDELRAEYGYIDTSCFYSVYTQDIPSLFDHSEIWFSMLLPKWTVAVTSVLFGSSASFAHTNGRSSATQRPNSCISLLASVFCHTIQFGVHWFASGSGITNKSSLFVTTLRKQKEHSKTHRTPSGIFGQRNDWGMVIVLFGVLGFPLNLLQAGGVLSISRILIGFALRRVYPHTGNLGNQQICLATSLLPFIRSGGRSAPARLFC